MRRQARPGRPGLARSASRISDAQRHRSSKTAVVQHEQAQQDRQQVDEIVVAGGDDPTAAAKIVVPAAKIRNGRARKD